jgi:peptidoglycan hydrolase FlgJ
MKILNNNAQVVPQNPNNEKNIKQVAKDFEELFLQQILKTAFKDLDIAGKGAGSDIMKDMYLENISKATAGNMGISQLMIEHLSNKPK